MQWILIKNNFKLILRRKWMLLLVAVAPILLIGLLSSAFADMMASYQSTGNITVGYEMEENSIWEPMIASLKDMGITDIHFQKYEPENISEFMEQGSCDVFVHFAEKDYTIYETEQKKEQGLTVEYFLNELSEQSVCATLQQQTSAAVEDIELKATSLSGSFQISAVDYYGIIYIVYFCCTGIILIAPVFSSERKNSIGARYGTAPVWRGGLYFGKLVPRIVTASFLTLVSAVLSTALYDIHWGNVAGAVGIIVLTIVTTSCVDVFFSYLCRNMAISTGIVFSMVWGMGFVGGSFETYLYSSTPQWLKDLTPLYYVNRTLVEYSVNGQSSYTGRCVWYLAGIAAVFFLAGIWIANRREGEVIE